MMRIKVYLPGLFDHTPLDDDGFILLEEGSTLGKLIARLKIPLVARPFLLLHVNYERANQRTRLKDGDVVTFVMPITGG